MQMPLCGRLITVRGGSELVVWSSRCLKLSGWYRERPRSRESSEDRDVSIQMLMSHTFLMGISFAVFLVYMINGYELLR